MSENIVCYKVLSLKKKKNNKKKWKEKVGTWKRAMLVTETVRGTSSDTKEMTAGSQGGWSPLCEGKREGDRSLRYLWAAVRT